MVALLPTLPYGHTLEGQVVAKYLRYLLFSYLLNQELISSLSTRLVFLCNPFLRNPSHQMASVNMAIEVVLHSIEHIRIACYVGDIYPLRLPLVNFNQDITF